VHLKKRRNRKASEDVVWVKDTTIVIDDPDAEESESEFEEEEEQKPINLNINIEGDQSINIEIKEESGEAYEEFLSSLLKKHGSLTEQKEFEENPVPKRTSPRGKKIEPAMKLTKKELGYFHGLTIPMQKQFNEHMRRITEISVNENDMPLRFRVLEMPVSDYTKSNVLKKIAALEEESGETYKLRNWVDAFLRVPFGKVIPLPVKLTDGREKCSAFMKESRSILDKAVFGMVPAKTQIMQVLAQWMANPGSIGNVIALQGPAGVGKTSIARNGIAQALKRPFEFFSLGGASDISNFIGHSYTYEGSVCGRIIESLMQARCMNPVMYFDELDKVSTTAHGEEIISMLIHLTDRSQNSQFHDRYLAGIDLDLSQCLFVFSFNDISAVNPILKDRMQVIHCSGYSEKDKQTILEDYVWPQLLERLSFAKEDIVLTETASKFMISEYSGTEQGIRTLIRIAESILTRLNMLRIADEDTMKDYKFYTKVEFPMKLTEPIIKTLLCDLETKELESWRSMYN
jgi:ATP-dependent Lon protease